MTLSRWLSLVLLGVWPATAACGGESQRRIENEEHGSGGSSGTAGSSGGSSGASGSSGSAGTGGSMAGPGKGGSGGTSNPEDETCSSSVTFHVSSASPAPHCVSSCGLSPVIMGADGVTFSLGGCGITRCSPCQATGCPTIDCVLQPMSPAGIDVTWDGSAFATSTCNGDTTCQVKRCAPAGTYLAKFCSWNQEDGSCPDLSTKASCIELDFDFPGKSEPIEVVLD